MRRRLGQHFLRAASVQRLLRVIDPRPDQTFLEIGAGAGALTLPLAQRAGRVVAIELDNRLAQDLAERAPDNVEVMQGDALAMDLRGLAGPGTRLVGNLPYYVSSPLLRRFLDLRGHVADIHVMVQDEVAERVASGPGSKVYGILSVLYGLWTTVDMPLRFPPGAFAPPPRVHSAVLRARFLEHPRARVEDAGALEALLRTAFGQRRKTLENNLKDSYASLKEHLRLLNIVGSRRPETLSVEDFVRLSNALRTSRNGE